MFADRGATDYNPHSFFSLVVRMKSASFIIDRRLHELLQENGYTQFTTRDLRDAYAERLGNMSYKLSDVRLFVYEQIRRMIRVGWLVLSMAINFDPLLANKIDPLAYR